MFAAGERSNTVECVERVTGIGWLVGCALLVSVCTGQGERCRARRKIDS